MAELYGKDQCLLLARCSFFKKKVVSCSKFVLPEKLPPTPSASNYHSKRVYYQIMQWMGFAGDMDPLIWGWKSEQNKLIPQMTNVSIAPDCLMKIIHCNCTGGCKNNKCSCRRHGLPCTSICGPCQTENPNCMNPNNLTLDVDLEDDQDSVE